MRRRKPPENGIDRLMEARGGDTAQLVTSLLHKHEALSWNLRSLIKSSSTRAMTWSVTLTQEERIGLYGVGSTPQQLKHPGERAYSSPGQHNRVDSVAWAEVS